MTLVAVGVALAGTGFLSARVGDAPARPAVLRIVLGGLLAMAVTYGDRLADRRRARLSRAGRSAVCPDTGETLDLNFRRASHVR